MNYTLPTSVTISGADYEIRTDFRAVLDILAALADPDLSDREKVTIMLSIFYFNPDCTEIPDNHIQEAVDKCVWFIDCGEESPNEKKKPKIMDWEQDFPYIAAPINRIIGRDIRGIPYDPKTNSGGLHWWTFVSAYYEIGDCTFAQIVRIRSAKAKGRKLDKSDQEWYRNNRHLVDFKKIYTDADQDALRQWGAK